MSFAPAISSSPVLDDTTVNVETARDRVSVMAATAGVNRGLAPARNPSRDGREGLAGQTVGRQERSGRGDVHAHNNQVSKAKWNPSENLLATGCRGALVKVFDVRTLRGCTFRGHTKEVTSLAWHPHHEQLLTAGGFDGSLLYWLVGQAEAEPAAEVRGGHEAAVWSLAWHPAGHILCTGSNDNTTKFWCRNRPGEVPRDTTTRQGPAAMMAEAAAAARGERRRRRRRRGGGVDEGRRRRRRRGGRYRPGGQGGGASGMAPGPQGGGGAGRPRRRRREGHRRRRRRREGRGAARRAASAGAAAGEAAPRRRRREAGGGRAAAAARPAGKRKGPPGCDARRGDQ